MQAYLSRIEEVNFKGPALHAVIETNPKALSQAADLDDERKVKGSRGPLHGIPLLLKDNIATLHEEGEIHCVTSNTTKLSFDQGMNTTAGTSIATGFHLADHNSFLYLRFLRTDGFCCSSRCVCYSEIT